MARDHDPIPGLGPSAALIGQISPYVRHCGDSRRGPWKLAPRKLLDYLLVYIADGRGHFRVGEEAWEVEPGDLFWIPPDTVHALEGYPPAMRVPYAHFDLVYRPERSHWDFSIPGGMCDIAPFAHLMHPPLPESPLARLGGRIRTATNRRVGDLLIELCEEAARAQPYANLRMSGLLVEILAEILRGEAGLGEGDDAHIPALEEAAVYLRGHCGEEDVTVEAAAALCDLSESHFRLLFRRHYGCPPRAYLRRARIRLAKELMVTSRLNLSEIARRIGFASVHGFSRAFRKEEGIAPSAYRRNGTPRTFVEGRAIPYAR